jgi:hypothetical protein
MGYGDSSLTSTLDKGHYATNRKVAGSISNEVIGFFFSVYLILPSCIMVLRSTEMSIRNLPAGEERPERKADDLAAIYEAIV